ncbi:TonB-dependent receptor [Echinicola sp. CAU 1574]|uniref:TonB-dependent receptor n=1 Tax=Echinicola arenosa TaxID=2774144 RepID=A0ABR9ALS8_9BACT|nr:TonB-dependent receptor [Echinicola arenosa]MBD8489504.1 TonB-dependent receptor [Echinicola arenosa]
MKKIISRFLIPMRILKTMAFFSLFGPICLSAKADRLIAYEFQNAKDITITGTVMDENNQPIPGATVLVESTGKGTVTDLDGNYRITVPEGTVLTFSFIGYVKQDVSIAGRSVINIVLKEDTKALDEVVVIGYQTVRKENLTGAVDQVTSEVLSDRPIKDLGQGLKGLIPNLNIGLSSGAPNSEASFNIRGFTGMNSKGSPLILVDGVAQDINTINPEDVASISVLKDAASSAIYGSRAPHGVILITTKSGKSGDMQINVSSNVSFSQIVGVPEGINSVDFANAWNDAFVNAQQAPYFSEETIAKMQAYMNGTSNINAAIDPGNGRWGAWGDFQFGNTQWQDAAYRDWQVNQKHTVSFSGGAEDNKLNYYASLGWNQNQGLMSELLTDQFNRYNATLKLSTKVNKWLGLSLNNRYSRSISDRPYYGSGDYSFTEMIGGRVWPTVPFYNPDGNMPYNNPLFRLSEGGNAINTEDDFWTTASIDLTPVKGLLIKGSYSFNTYSRDYAKAYNHITAITDYTDEEGTYWYYEWAYENYPNSYVSQFNRNNYHQIDLYANYDLSINDHSFSAIVGYQEELKQLKQLYGYKTNLITEDVPSLSTAIGEAPSVDDALSHWSTRGYFGRLKYNYKEKYLVEFNGRYDASSRFPTDTRWAFFPSVSAAYNITNEDFWSLDQISMLKLRGSYGELGNQNVSNYAYLPTMSVTAKTGNVIGGTRVPAVRMPGLVSPDITWEKPRTLDIGFDVLAFNDKLSLTYDWYQRTIYDQIGVSEELPEVLGTSVPQRNNAVSETRGWELSVGWRDNTSLAGKPFNWGAKFILSDYIGYVVEYENASGSMSGTWTPGERFGAIYGYEVEGTASSSADFTNNASLHRLYSDYWFPGDLIYKDLDGDGMVGNGTGSWYNKGDLVNIGNSSPRYTYGVTLTADWNGFDMRMNFEGVAKQDLWFSGLYYQGVDTGGSMWFSTFMKHSLDYWTPENTGAYFPRPYMSSQYGGKFRTNDQLLTNAAYLRFRTLQLGYTFPSLLTQKLAVKKLRLFTSIENLGLLMNKSHVKIDPMLLNNSGGRTYPPQRTFSLGLNLTF